MSERNYYVIREDNCRFEAMTKEQILTAIQQAVEEGEIRDVNTGFITKIREKNANRELMFWVGTQAQYNAITTPETNVMYLITDPQAEEEMQAQIDALKPQIKPAGELLWEDSGGAAAGDTITFTDTKGYTILMATTGNIGVLLVPSAERAYIGTNALFVENVNKVINFYCAITESEEVGNVRKFTVYNAKETSILDDTLADTSIYKIYGIA